MNIVVTGSTGFIGRHLVPALLLDGHSVLELTRDSQKSGELFQNSTQKILVNDDHESLAKAIEAFRPELCIHLASYLTSGDSYPEMIRLIDSNLLYVSKVLDGLKKSGVQFFINTGTSAEYFGGGADLNPAYLYAATKTASRHIVDYYSKVYGFTYTTIIPYTIYGADDSQKKVIDLIYDSLQSDTALDLSPGGQIVDFIHINDVVNFYLTVINNYKTIPAKKVFKLGTGKGTTIKQLAALLENLSNKKANINWGGKPYRPRDLMLAVADTTEQVKLFKWQSAVNLEQGIKMYLNNKQK